MDRRSALALLGLLVLAALAGCSSGDSIELQPVRNDTELATRASQPATLPAEDSTRERGFVRAVIENGSATTRGQGPPIETELPYVHEGRYYNLTRTVVDERPGVAVDVEIDYNGSASSPGATGGDDGTVAYESLSGRDRFAIDQLLAPRTDRRTEGSDFGLVIPYDETERNRSVLLSGRVDAVTYDGTTYPISVGRTERVTIRTYRYTATVVANSTTAYASEVRKSYLFPLDGLSAEERQIVETAIEETHYADSADNEAFRSVVEEFRRHRAIRRSSSEGTWLVRYDGEVYLADLSYGGLDPADTPSG